MKKLSKKLAIYVTAIVLAIGFLFPASVLADIDPGTKIITVSYNGAVNEGASTINYQGTYSIEGADFTWNITWYYGDEYLSSATLEKDKTYTVEVKITKSNEAAQAYDLSEYEIDLKTNDQPFPYDTDKVIGIDKAFDKLIYTYQFTPQALPDMNLGAKTLDLSKGPVNITDCPGILLTLEALSKFRYIQGSGMTSDSEGYIHMPADLDKDGNADIEVIVKDKITNGVVAAYGDVSGKAPITFKFTAEELAELSQDSEGEPYYSSITFIFSASATSISKATIKGITAKAYTGKALKPTPKVALKGKTLKKGTDYTVTYKNNVNVGTATVVIKGQGDYYGTKTKTFKINPKGASLKSVTKASKAVKVKWTKQAAKMKTSRITGYQILLAT
ncbi:MAG: hypothetical protein IKE49_01075, partial [Firmicutes bacterium]|nr:hypothetical protein [Bacillota bacterium]